ELFVGPLLGAIGAIEDRKVADRLSICSRQHGRPILNAGWPMVGIGQLQPRRIRDRYPCRHAVANVVALWLSCDLADAAVALGLGWPRVQRVPGGIGEYGTLKLGVDHLKAWRQRLAYIVLGIGLGGRCRPSKPARCNTCNSRNRSRQYPQTSHCRSSPTINGH